VKSNIYHKQKYYFSNTFAWPLWRVNKSQQDTV